MLVGIMAVCQAEGQIVPTYSSVFQDASMKASKFRSGGEDHWSVPDGADNYAVDEYERPTNQTYRYYNGKYATEGDYFGNLDIERASFGHDDKYLYVRIDLVDSHLHTKSGESKNEGLIYEYRFRINTGANGAGGYLFTTDQPSSQGSNFHTEKNFGYRDRNGDAHRNGDGYESDLVSDGKHSSSGKKVLYSRIDPSDSSVVEFALEYAKVGLDLAAISSIVFEANKGLKDRSNYPWNKEYRPSEAGSPNGGPSGKSEFGTSGLENIYELDTLTGVLPFGGVDPRPPASAAPPTGELTVSSGMLLRGTFLPVGYTINRD